MEEQVKFPVGEIVLEGLLSAPDKKPRAGVVICHPHPLFGGDMHNNVVTSVAQALQQAGHATLRFNFRGVGLSGGLHDEGQSEEDDVKAAVECLLASTTPDIVAVAGYSFGSTVGLKAGVEDPRVGALIGIALPIARRDVTFLEGTAKPKLLISGDRDDISPADRLRTLVGRLAEPKQLVLVSGADHFFIGLEQDVADAVVRFLDGVAASKL